MIHRHGLVLKWRGLECQFRGDWSQRIASLTSESDPPLLQARRFSVICHTIFSASLPTWIASLRIHVCLRRNNLKASPGHILRGYVSIIIFFFWLSVNSLSSPVNGYSEGRWQTANVGVHSFITRKHKYILIHTHKNILWIPVLNLSLVVFRVHFSEYFSWPQSTPVSFGIFLDTSWTCNITIEREFIEVVVLKIKGWFDGSVILRRIHVLKAQNAPPDIQKNSWSFWKVTKTRKCLYFTLPV